MSYSPMSPMETMHSDLLSHQIFSYCVISPVNPASSEQVPSLCLSFYVLFYEQLSLTRAVCVAISTVLSYRAKWTQLCTRLKRMAAPPPIH